MDENKGLNFFDFLSKGGVAKKVAVPDDIKAIQNAASVMYQEDNIERTAQTTPASFIQLYPDFDRPGKWIIHVKFAAKQTQNNPMAVLMSGNSEAGSKFVNCPSFEYGLAFLEKNKFFNLKETKFEECIFASWG